MPKSKRSKEQEEFAAMTDEELVAEVHARQNPAAQRYLLEKYRKLVLGKTKGYFLVGAERDDVVQEGMIGLFKAIRDYSPERKASFRVFADLCVGRQIITAIKNSTRQKQMPLNTYVSINKPLYMENPEHTLLDVLAGIKIADPEEMVVDKESFKVMEESMSALLSELEWRVLRGYLDGKSYQEIAKDLHRPSKSIDNALTRVKKKMTKYKDANEEKINPRLMQKGFIALSVRAEEEERRKKAGK